MRSGITMLLTSAGDTCTDPAVATAIVSEILIGCKPRRPRIVSTREQGDAELVKAPRGSHRINKFNGSGFGLAVLPGKKGAKASLDGRPIGIILAKEGFSAIALRTTLLALHHERQQAGNWLFNERERRAKGRQNPPQKRSGRRRGRR